MDLQKNEQNDSLVHVELRVDADHVIIDQEAICYHLISFNVRTVNHKKRFFSSLLLLFLKNLFE